MGVFNADGSYNKGWNSSEASGYSGGSGGLIDWDKAYQSSYERRKKNKQLETIRVGDFTYTEKKDGTYAGPKGQTRTLDQINRLRGIESNYQSQMQEIQRNGVNPQTIAQDIGGAAKSVLIDFPVEAVKYAADRGKTALMQGGLGVEAGSSNNKMKAAQKLLQYNEEDFKAGKIDQSQYEQNKVKFEGIISKYNPVVKQAEKRYGTKLNSSEGFNAAAETALNFVGTGALVSAGARGVEKAAQRIFTVLSKDAEKNLGRKLTTSEVTKIEKRSEDIAAKVVKQETTPEAPKSGSFAPNDFKVNAPEGTTFVPGKPMAPAPLNTSVHVPGVGYAPLNESQATKLKNEIDAIKWNTSDRPHLSAIDSQLTKQSQEVSLETLANVSPKVKQALEKAGININDQGMKVAGSAQKLRNELVQQGVESDLGPIAGYESGSYKVGAEQASQLVKNDYAQSLDIAMGRTSTGDVITDTAVRHEVAQVAREQGDWQTIQQLTNSSQHTAVSEAAQQLGAEGYYTVADDPVKALQVVRDARTRAVTKRSGKPAGELVNRTTRSIEKTIPKVKKDDWASFVQSLECK